MKKMRNTLLTLGALVAALMTVACSDVNNTTTQTQNSANRGITISGSLSAGTGRSATSSLASDTITWKVAAATKGETGGPNYASAIFGSVSEDMTFTITLPEAGDYYFIATGYVTAEQETQVLQGKTDIINVTAEGRSNIVITAKPSSSEESGKISLPISDESGKIANILIYEDGDDSPCFEKSFLSREVLFAHENPTAGVHIYQFCFDDANGNTLYTCREAVTVFSSLTTDTWIGNAPYFVQNEDGTARFVITEELLKKYDAEAVPSTQTVLYEHDTENGWSYSLANSDSLLDNAYNQADFCFDAEGNVYLGTNLDLMQFYYYDVSKNQVYSIQVLNSDNEEMQISSSGFLDYDFAKNQLWFVTDGCFYKFSQLNKNSSESPVTYSANVTAYSFRTTDSGAGNLLSACIYNDKAYLVYSTVDNNDVPYVLLEYDISSAEVDEEEPTQFSIGTPKATKELCAGMDLSSAATITDMLYQDGAVYMLLKEMNTTTSFFSRGALLRYNTLTSSVDTLGFSDQVDKSSLANAKISAYTYVPDDGYKPLYNDNALTTQWFVNANKEFEYSVPKILYNELPGIFTPAITTSISTEQFYGPSKFVAVKPKKLVIADDGIAFYTDNDVLKCKNVNRIVTVDLNSFSIVGTEDVSANFGGESSKEIVIAKFSESTMYQYAVADEVSSESPKYYENNDGARLTSVDGVYLVAPCGD